MIRKVLNVCLQNNFVTLEHRSFRLELDAVDGAVHDESVDRELLLLPSEEHEAGPCHAPQSTFPDDVLDLAQLVHLGRADGGQTISCGSDTGVQAHQQIHVLQSAIIGQESVTLMCNEPDQYFTFCRHLARSYRCR